MYQDGWTPKCCTPTPGAPLGVILQKGDPGRTAEGRAIPQAQHTLGCSVHRHQTEGMVPPSAPQLLRGHPKAQPLLLIRSGCSVSS